MESETQEKENAGFLRPKPLRLRKRGPVARATPLPPPLQEVDKNSLNTIYSPSIPRNPFRRLDGKRKVEEDSDDDGSLLWRHTHRNLEHVESLPVSPVVPSMLDECALDPFSLHKDTKEKKIPPPTTSSLGIDWSLKTKIRFISPTPFPSRGNFRTFEEVNGTIGYVRCLHPGQTDKCDSSEGAKFFQQSLVWQHPSLPWLSLFPRSAQKHSGSAALNASAQEILHSKWCDSFRSLYQLVRLYQCPFFYVCAPAFTVLFRCAGAATQAALHALITPTTRGLRNALTEEGISFTMPLCKEESDTPEDSPDDNQDDVEKDDDLEEEGSWLESLGLSQDAFPSLHKKRRCDKESIDHRPQSLVHVDDTQALVNFLLCSTHFCTDRMGPMAGVPPTLLAPVAFLGGTLQSLQMRHGRVLQGDQEWYSVELCGPLLPSSVHSLCSLLSSTQSEFSATITQHNSTQAFAQVQPQSSPLPTIFAQNNLGDCGLPTPFVHQMCCPPANEPTRTLKAKGGLFTITH